MKQFPGFDKIKFFTITLLLLTASLVYGKTSSPNTVFFNSFDAKFTGNAIELKWLVTEYNNRDFMVQHSTNGMDWENVAIVPSKRSAESLEDYSYKHPNSSPGKHYYRLYHTDIDAMKSGYSRVISISVTGTLPQLSIWPNPVMDQFTIVNNSKGADIYTIARLYDLSGKMILEQKLQAGNNPIVIGELATGTYIIKAESDNGLVFTQKLLKQ